MDLWLLPWRWEDDEAASPILGIPTAQSISNVRLEETIQTKVDNKLHKIQNRQLTLAARVTVANSVLLGCVWYFLFVWSGKECFLNCIQGKVDRFVWAGRSRVARAVATLPTSARGLGLINLAAQYRALTGSLMIWTTLNDPHPLRQILQCHIKEVSMRRWGTPDLAWIVTSCGTMRMSGSKTWQSICRGWGRMKKCILHKRPVNLEGWRALPLWRPHVNHLRPNWQGAPQVN